MGDNETDGTGSGPPGKVARVIDERDLDGLGESLERRWTGSGVERESLRDLADRFNRRVVRAAMEAAGMQVLEGEAGTVYDLLRGEDASAGARTEAERRLERAGVDVERLRDDFVSHQSLHTYLTDDRGASSPSDDGRDVSDVRRTVQRLRNRTDVVVEESIEQLRDGGDLAVGDVDVLVSVRVTCQDCGHTYDAVDLLDRAGCACDGS
ncbi:MAG: rod-determining factor RdfA [Halorientalis sp.]